MKAISFRCEDCGTLITARPDSPGGLQCPNCGGGVRRFEEAPALDATLVGVAVSGVASGEQGEVVEVCSRDAQDSQEEVREGSRDVFHRLVPWLGASCLHAAGILMLMFAVASAVTPPMTHSPGAVADTVFTIGVTTPAPAPVLKDPDPGSLFDKSARDLTAKAKPNRSPAAAARWGIRDGRGGAGGGHDAVIVRTRKTPYQPKDFVIGGGPGASIAGPEDLTPPGPDHGGIFAGPDQDPYGKDLVVGPIHPEPGGRVDNVVFVIDQSGSVLPAFGRICGELVDYISYLGDTQSFHVVFFAKDSFQENPARRLVAGTEQNKVEAARFLRTVQASGYGSCPIPALEAAFRALAGAKAEQSKLLYLLTDGDFETSGREYRSGGRVLRGNEAVVAWLRDHNANQAVQVNVVIIGEKPSSEAEACMRTIAKDNRGLYHYVESK